MKKGTNKLHKILLVIIGVLAVIMAALLIHKVWKMHQEKLQIQEWKVRQEEVQAELYRVQVQIQELSDDSDALQEFLDEKFNESDAIIIETPEETLPLPSEWQEESISGNEQEQPMTEESVSGNEQEQPMTEESVSGNEPENTISGNAIVDGQVIPFRYEEKEITLEQRRNIRSSYAETMLVNGEDKQIIGNSSYDFLDMKIACLGDSLTAGSNLDNMENYQQYSYPAVLKELLHAKEVYNLGIGGSSYGRYWDQAFVDRYRDIPQDTDIIVVMGGTNDGFAASADELGSMEEKKARTFYGDVDELMRGLRNDYPNAKIIFATPLPNVLHDYLRNQREYLLPQNVFADAVKDLAAQYQIDVIDLYNSNILDTHDAQIISTYMPDGVHGNPAGYQILAEHMAGQIIRIMEKDARYQSVSGNSVPEEGNVSGNFVPEEDRVSDNSVTEDGGVSDNAVTEETDINDNAMKERDSQPENAGFIIVEEEKEPEENNRQETGENKEPYEYHGEAIVIQ